MGNGKIFPEYEIVLKEKKEQAENKKNVAALFTVLFIVQINYVQARRVWKSIIINNI